MDVTSSNIIVINKSDRPGANKLMISLQNVISTLTIKEDQWIIKIIHTVFINQEFW